MAKTKELWKGNHLAMLMAKHWDLPADIQAPPTETGELGDMVRRLVASGMPPARVADAVHDAVVDNQFWILTHEESKEAVTARADEIVTGTNPSARAGFREADLAD